MARAHFVKKARKPIPEIGVEKGDSYYWWKFRFGSKQVSKEQPKRSQLTQSEWLGHAYDIEDSLEALTKEDVASELPSLIEEIQGMQGEMEDRLSNMPEGLQDSSILNEYISNCESWASDLENIQVDDCPEAGDDLTQEADESDEDFEARQEAADNEVDEWWSNIESELSCSPF